MKKRWIRSSVACLLVLLQLLMLFGCKDDAPDPNLGTDEPTQAVNDTTGGDTPDPEDPKTEADMQLKYDDRYSFDSPIKSIETISVTSKSLKTGELDEAVLQIIKDSESKSVLACGVGTAKVSFDDGSEQLIEVVAADISMLLIIGQSNAEGQIQPDTGNQDPATYKAAINQSILCEEGQIYSTYAPGLSLTHGNGIGNARFHQTLSITNARDFVAKSLTSTACLNGAGLTYPLNSLSINGGGKTGVDSGIAYEWHRKTGEKVWVINAAHGGSGIATWQPGTNKTDNNFWQAVELFSYCQETMQKEVQAGHYRLNQMGYFWLQGCADMGLSAKEYTDAYEKMHLGLKKELTFSPNGDGEEMTICFGGIMMVRAAISPHTTSADLMMRGPRIAQYYMGQTNTGVWKDVYLASTACESWTSNKGVERYFANKYGKAYPYSMRTEVALPTSMYEIHPNIHYRQLGYNEVGITAACNMVDILQNKIATEDAKIKLVKVDGMTQFAAGALIELNAGDKLIAVPKSNMTLLSNECLELTTDIEALQIECYSITAPFVAEDLTGHLYVQYRGEIVLTYDITVRAVVADVPQPPNTDDYGSTVYPEI